MSTIGKINATLLIALSSTVFEIILTTEIKTAPPDIQARLTEGRDFLKTTPKRLEPAQRIFSALINEHVNELNSVDLCHIYCYLGYIADHKGHREKAKSWFEKAWQMEGEELKWIKPVAQKGLTAPVTWIRHLDASSVQSPRQTNWRSGIIDVIDSGHVTTIQPPRDLKPADSLTSTEMRKNFDILCVAFERHFSFFEHKKLDWSAIRNKHQAKLADVKSADEFYSLLRSLVRDLHDSHSWLCNYPNRSFLANSTPGVETQLIEGKAVVTRVQPDSLAEKSGLKKGDSITTIDDQSVKDRVESIRQKLNPFSSERGFLDAAYRKLLCGPSGSKCKISFKHPGNENSQTIELLRSYSWNYSAQPQPFIDYRGKYVWSGRHPSGCGYIRILSFNGRDKITVEFDKALKALKDTPALILDIRDNLGGFGTGQNHIVGRFLAKTRPVAVSYRRVTGKNEFTSTTSTFGSTGKWQYTKPIALLLNSRTGSAADLFANYLINTGRPITLGTTTHGNLTGIGVYAVLPCNLTVRISNGYVCDTKGNIIEGNGNKPKVEVGQTISDLIANKDTVLERAVKELIKDQETH